jgi:hypothetical protein
MNIRVHTDGAETAAQAAACATSHTTANTFIPFGQVCGALPMPGAPQHMESRSEREHMRRSTECRQAAQCSQQGVPFVVLQHEWNASLDSSWARRSGQGQSSCMHPDCILDSQQVVEALSLLWRMISLMSASESGAVAISLQRTTTTAELFFFFALASAVAAPVVPVVPPPPRCRACTQLITTRSDIMGLGAVSHEQTSHHLL